MAMDTQEERAFSAMHEGLTGYIHHRIPNDSDRAEDVYMEIIDRIIELTEHEEN